MQIARVIGTLVATQKHRKLEGAKLLLVQPLALDGAARGVPLLAIDSVGAGVGERVLVVIEGRAAGEALGRKAAPVDAAIIGIIDHVDLDDETCHGRTGAACARARGCRATSGCCRQPAVAVGAVPGATSGAWSQDPRLTSICMSSARPTCVTEPAVTCDHCGYCESHDMARR